MSELPKVIENQAGTERVVIRKRLDGRYTYHREFRDGVNGGWSIPGPDCGIYESALTAEAEARQRVAWLRAQSH
jgi:hypothetical protein